VDVPAVHAVHVAASVQATQSLEHLVHALLFKKYPELHAEQTVFEVHVLQLVPHAEHVFPLR
jgi:hypothetical protein